MIELPEYRLPCAKHTIFCVREKTEEYLAKAGTTIVLSSVLLWFLLHTGFSGFVSDISCSFAASARPFACASFFPGRSGRLADSRRPAVGAFCQGGRSVQFFSSLRNSERQFGRRHGMALFKPFCFWLWTCKRLCPDGILPSLHALLRGCVCGEDRNGRWEMDCLHGGISAGACISGGVSCVPDWLPAVSWIEESGKTRQTVDIFSVHDIIQGHFKRSVKDERQNIGGYGCPGW